MTGVLVVLEQRDLAWNRMSWEAVAAGQRLAAETGQPLRAAVAAHDVGSLSSELSATGADKAYAVLHELLRDYTPDGYTLALEQLIRAVDPAYVVFPHTYQVRDFAPRLATRFGQVLIADVIGVEFRDGPVFQRQLMQGKLTGDYRHSGNGPCFVSVQAGAFRAAETPGSAPAPLETFTPVLDASQIRSRVEAPFREAAQTVDLTSAEIIVSVGRGIKEKENIPIVAELAEALGAELAASRPICDNGWLPMQRQVGSSGQTVSPKLYIAVGISGAIQHLVGMKGSKAVVAINKDENAPILEIADYAIVGDLFEVVPALTSALRKARAAGQ
jgi:electron transfer flavoprotein alpha subunit